MWAWVRGRHCCLEHPVMGWGAALLAGAKAIGTVHSMVPLPPAGAPQWVLGTLDPMRLEALPRCPLNASWLQGWTGQELGQGTG